MICKVADLIVEIPEAGGMAPRCKDYGIITDQAPDIVINEELYNYSRYPELSKEIVAYNHSGMQFYKQLLEIDGMMLHSSAVVRDGYAYLFSGPSRVGKSTHTSLWTELYDDAVIINDDKPALRRVDGRWYAYGTPWSGKHPINRNLKAVLAGICILERGEGTAISTITRKEAFIEIFAQSTRYQLSEKRMDCLLGHISSLISEIPVYRMHCTPDILSAELSYNTMRRGAEERGL